MSVYEWKTPFHPSGHQPTVKLRIGHYVTDVKVTGQLRLHVKGYRSPLVQATLKLHIGHYVIDFKVTGHFK